jgi:Spy/CpxP family protein refolding chaperone
VGQILDDSWQKLRDLQKQLDPQFQAIHQDTRVRIRQVLNADQQKKFDELVRSVEERHRRRGPPPPP